MQCLLIPQKIYKLTKRLKTPDEVEKYFPVFLSFIDSIEQQQIPRPTDNKRKTMFYSGKKKRHTAVKMQFMVNNHGIIIHKVNHKKERDMTMIFIRGIILLLPNKLLM